MIKVLEFADTQQQPLTFDMINNGWNAIRMSGAPNLRKLVTGFIEPSRILLKLVSDTPDSLTVMFKGFDVALDDPDDDTPILKRAILSWVKTFAQAQIADRGNPETLMLRIMKPQVLPATQTPAPAMAEQVNPHRPLVQITRTKNA